MKLSGSKAKTKGTATTREIPRLPHSPAAHSREHPELSACKDTFSLVEPQINGEGIHIWAFDPLCPVDVLFMTTGERECVRMNRHDYFEVLYLCSGSGVVHAENRLLAFHEGDLAIIGSTVKHRVECRSASPLTIAALFFEPGFIACEGANHASEYLFPFLIQDENFPHVVDGQTGVPLGVLDLMLCIQAESPARDPMARLAIKTHLQAILMILMKQYAAYARKREQIRSDGSALEGDGHEGSVIEERL
jgi:hypothetical protein